MNNNGHNHEATSKSGDGAGRQRVMILDDHPLVCEGLSALIREREELAVMGAYGSVSDAMQALQTQLPDLLLLDISLPKASGLDVLKDLRVQYPSLQVLVVSMYDEALYAELVFRLGARGYIMKQEASEKIVEAILHVLSGGVYASENVTSKMLSRLCANGHRKQEETGLALLADREVQVYTLIGEGCSTREIAERLGVSLKTVQTHREHIKGKLGFKTSAELTRSAMLWFQNP